MNFIKIPYSIISRNFLLKLTIFISFFIITPHLHAQIDIKSKVDAQTYADYSKAIDLFSSTFPFQDTIMTLFIPDNYSISRLTTENYSKVFIEKNNQEINNFFKKYIIHEKLSELFLNKVIDSNINLVKNNINNEVINFTKNGNLILVLNNNMYESNINRIINYNNKLLIVLLFGGFEK